VGGSSPVVVRVHRYGRVDGPARLGRILQRRRADVLAYFDRDTSTGPADAMNGRLETLHRNVLGF
jgi:transposase